MDLSSVIRKALCSFASENRGDAVYARELVSCFVFAHLLCHVQANGPISSPAQIGVEVAVPQRRIPGARRRDPDVCKDVVIWSAPGMVCWDSAGHPTRFPAAVLEWKSLNLKDSAASVRRKLREEYPADCDWLQWFVTASPGSEGYAVLVDSRQTRRHVRVARFSAGGEDVDWLVHPAV
jgi:hypothetical protein